MTVGEIKNTTRNSLGQYSEFSVPGHLAPFFEYFWVYEGSENQNPATSHRVLPDPDSSIVLRAHWVGGPPPENTAVEFHGPITKPYVYHPGKTETLVAARVKSEWLVPLLGTRADEVSDYAGPLSAIDKAMAEKMLTDLSKTGSWIEAMAGLTETMTQWCAEKNLDDILKKSGLAQQAGLLARRAKGATSAATLAEALGVSERHLFRCFRGEVGSSPKDISRRLRFLTAVTLADSMSKPDWAGIAIDAGYFDQSHMIRDFKALCALTPNAVFSERRAESNLPNTG